MASSCSRLAAGFLAAAVASAQHDAMQSTCSRAGDCDLPMSSRGDSLLQVRYASGKLTSAPELLAEHGGAAAEDPQDMGGFACSDLVDMPEPGNDKVCDFHLSPPEHSSAKEDLKFMMHAYPHDNVVSGSICKHGSWEPLLLKTMWRSLAAAGEEAVLIDMGTNIGVYSLVAAALGHRVVAFEMMKPSYTKVCASAKDNGFAQNIHFFTGALSNTTGEVVSFTRTEHTNNVGATAKDKATSDQGCPQSSAGVDCARTLTADAVMRYRGSAGRRSFQELVAPTTPVFLKIDIEGSECEMLAGGEREFFPHLKNLVFVMVEIWAKNLAKCKAKFDFLLEQEFCLQELRQMHEQSSGENFFYKKDGTASGASPCSKASLTELVASSLLQSRAGSEDVDSKLLLQFARATPTEHGE
eukprot:TRINITY_DN21784_c0_g1_i1.p1 TRINITY_DN21784_c0_g1~~TRINITY_DN21784_c0_g1_i1.p1  ORF type:complete len:432 (+),score=77.09 TRINITY_DN21784_c0_g1_i1:63-1298(+)